MSTPPVAASHGRVEFARQQLVLAEEKYLRAKGWMRVMYGGVWWWEKAMPFNNGRFFVADRERAAQFQHVTLGD